MTPGRKTKNGNYIKFGNEEIDTNRTHFELQSGTNEKMDPSDYDCKNRAMEFLAKNVRKRDRILTCG